MAKSFAFCQTVSKRKNLDYYYFIIVAESQASPFRVNSVAFRNVNFNNDAETTFLRISASNVVFRNVTLNIRYPKAIDISNVDELSFIDCHLGLHKVLF